VKVQVPSTSGRRCPNCGTVARVGAHYCSKCGFAIVSSPPAEPSPGPEPLLHNMPHSPRQHEPTSLPTHGANSARQSDEAQAPDQAGTRVQSSHGDQEKEQWPVLTYFKESLVVWNDLNAPLKVFLVITSVQYILVALLLFTQNWLQPLVNSGVIDSQGINYVVPLAILCFTALSIATGYWFTLAGALRVRWAICLLIVTLDTSLLAVAPITAIVVNTRGVGAGIEPFVSEIRLSWVQLGVLALLWILTLYTLWQKPVIPDRTYTAGQPGKSEGWHWWSFAGMGAALLLYYGLQYGIWLAYARAGLADTGTGFLLQTFSVQSLFLPYFLTILLLLASTDLLAWGEALAETVVFLAWQRKAPWLLLILAPPLALFTIGRVLVVDGRGVLLEVAVVAAPIGLVILLARFARIDSNWPEWPKTIRSLAVRWGAILLFLIGTLLSGGISLAAELAGLLDTASLPLYSLISVPLWLAALTIGLALLALGRSGNPLQGAVGLFLVMVILLVLTAQLPNFLTAIGWQMAYPQQHFALLNGVQVIVALAILVWIIRWLIRRNKLAQDAEPFPRAIGPFGAVFLLLAGLQIVPGIISLLKLISKAGTNSNLLLAGFFLLTIFWGLLTASETVSTQEKPDSASSSEGRALIFFGFTLISTAMVLFLGALHAVVRNKIVSAPDTLTTDYVSSGGLSLLGPALVALAFLLKVGRRTPHTEAVRPARQPTGQPARQGLVWGILASGGLISALVLMYAQADALPGILQTNTPDLIHPYVAAIPGPNCDTHGASWTITPGSPILTHCLPTGLQIEARTGNGSVLFVPANGTFPQNYSVSVTASFADTNACASIATRSSSSGRYESIVCAGGRWLIQRIDPVTTVLASGLVAPERTFTFAATTSGANQSLTLNGIVVATVADGAFASTAFLNLGIFNQKQAADSVIFRHFTYRSLPATIPASPRTVYYTATPGSHCTRGDTGQWAIMSLPTTITRCLPTGLQIATQARNFSLLGFTPPGQLFPQNYQVSMHITFNPQSSACAGFGLRATDFTYYGFDVCSNGNWLMNLTQFTSTTDFGSGSVAQAPNYTFTATAQGPDLSLTINGVQIHTHMDQRLTTTTYLLLGVINAAPATGTVVISNFTYIPLG
jgi:hypothetical protein